MVRATQHLEATDSVRIGIEVMVAAGTVTITVARRDVVHLAVATSGVATGTGAAVLGTTLCRGAGKAPDVVALPGSRATIGAPRASTRLGDVCVAPLASSARTGPGGEPTVDAAQLEGRIGVSGGG